MYASKNKYLIFWYEIPGFQREVLKARNKKINVINRFDKMYVPYF